MESLEKLLTLREERPFFLKKSFKSGEVNLGRVGLYLSEVGIDGAIKRNVGPDTHLDVPSDPGAEGSGLLKGIVGVGLTKI